ncbi:MAG: hypothetical protein DSO09_01835 [Candidatus Methanomethylicota archaeon]|jgi:flagellin FlaB|uniref:Flagellin n=1 Tax=Thermoproteota archaeon TaxID=2056631 RepID=A0A520KFF2_9CREN|nr:MAG: hypothetical protein EF809_04325 [Candidatus Verstraetearchaeota archaeon]TDA39709.1 MAG: hypothetical protein DSO09_01835 [Candidatus Verstraetearchaeota archaeon]
MKSHNTSKSRKGTIGVETAIIMIAFVVVASVVAYVIINMGFFSAQKTKETIWRGVESASTSLELDGSIIGRADSNGNYIEFLIVPIRLSVGRTAVDLSNNSVVVSVIGSNFTITNLYKGINDTTGVTVEKIIEDLKGTNENEAWSVIYNSDGDKLLELNEKAYIIIKLDTATYQLKPYDRVTIEIRIGDGAALTVTCQMPPGFSPNEYVRLG